LQYSKTLKVAGLRSKKKGEPYPGRTKKEQWQICFQFLFFQSVL